MKRIKGIAVFGCMVFAANINAQKIDFKADKKTGVKYHFYKHDKKGATPTEDDYAHVVMLWTGKNAAGSADSVYIDSHKKGGDSLGGLYVPLKGAFHGCLEDGIMMMASGDSAAFQINGDSLFLKTFHANPQRIPHFVTGNTQFIFSIKLLGFYTKDEMEAQRKAVMQKRMEQEQARKGQEAKDIADYLQKNNQTNIKPDADSIYYLQTTQGNGKHVQDGDSLEIQYRGTFLDGTSFDPPANSGREHSSFTIVYHQNMGLIQGWIKILGKMTEGEKVKVLIPSSMGYGARAMGPIQPYTPLIFDMELVRVKSTK